MAVRFVDSFDGYTYNSSALLKAGMEGRGWTCGTATMTAQTARTGYWSVFPSASGQYQMYWTMPAADSDLWCGYGAWFNLGTNLAETTYQRVFYFHESGGDSAWSVGVSRQGGIAGWRTSNDSTDTSRTAGNADVEDADAGIPVGQTDIAGDEIFTHVAFALDIANSGGTFQCWVNGVLVLDYTGDTQGQTSTQADKFVFDFSSISGSSFRTTFVDDFYCGDSDTSDSNNDIAAPPGDMRIYCSFPSADGDHTDWTPLSGNSIDNVDELDTDFDGEIDGNPDDTTYVSSSTTADKESWEYTNVDVPDSATGKFVQITTYARKDGVDVAKFRNIHRDDSAGTDDTSLPDHTLSTSWDWYVDIYGDDPINSGEWTEANFNDAEFGVENRS